jgi:hypothetical protein
MRFKKYTLIAILLSLVLLFALAEDSADGDEGGGFDIDFNLGLGVETFQEWSDTDSDWVDVAYQKLSLSPDISIGNFGIGLDVVIHYQFQAGELVIREEDWVPANFSDGLELYLAKFKYVRWGYKNDPLYVKFGSIEDALLGNGFILGGYSNTHFLPDYRIFGLNLDIDGALFNFPLVGIETFVANIVKPDVMGFRPFVRPLFLTELPILKNLELGLTFALDLDPFAFYSRLYGEDPQLFKDDLGITTTDDTVFFYGLDIFQPILASPIVSLAAFTDIARDKNSHTGWMLGAGGSLFSFLNYGAQLRVLGAGFIPTYFDPYYDLSRPFKYALLESPDESEGFVGWFASLGTSLLENQISLNFTLDGPFGALDSDVDNPLNYPHLTGSFNINEGLIPGLSFEASYDKVLIRQFADIIDPEGAILYARINYQTGPAVISLFYQLKYDPVQGWASDGNDVTSGLESLIKLN